MGQTFSSSKEREVNNFRKECKKKANELGFLTNKEAPKNSLNQRHDESKDPRSFKQAQDWKLPSSTSSPTHNVLDENFTTLVVDILECHNIGEYEVQPGAFNFIAVQLDAECCRHDSTLMFIETEGHKRCKWNEKFAIAMFDLNTSTAHKLLTRHHSTYKEKDNTRPKGKKKVTRRKYWTLEVRIACGYSKTLPRSVCASGSAPDASLVFKHAKFKESFKLKMNKSCDSILKGSSWTKFRDGSNMRARIELISTKKAPLLENFLPYTQWPPMILRTGKTRLQLMMEEEEYTEQVFQGELGESLLAYSPSTLPRILRVFADDYNRDFFLGLGIALGAPLVDRTETLYVSKTGIRTNSSSQSNSVNMVESYIKMFNKYPVNPFESNYFGSPDVGKDSAYKWLRFIMLERADAILNKLVDNTELKIKILWSGGIDTTAMVTAILIKIDEMDESRKNIVLPSITICYCKRSILEYPWFYDNVIKPRFNRYIIPKHVRDIVTDSGNNNTIVVTGDPADMMFGTYVMGTCLVEPHSKAKPNPIYMKLEQPWTIFADFMVHRKLLDPTAKPSWISWIKPFVEKSPIPVKTLFDFLWWCSYGLKYQHDLNRIFYNGETDTVPETLVKSIINFYDTIPFSQWSYKFHQSKMLDQMVWASYKWPLKQFILDFTKKLDPNHLDFYKAKLKVQSITNTFGFEHGLDSNYNKISWGKYSISRKHMNKKFPDGMLEKKFIAHKNHQISESVAKAKVETIRSGGDYGYSDDSSWLYWMYYLNTSPHQNHLYFTPATQSSGPHTGGGGSDYGGFEPACGAGGDRRNSRME